MIDGNTKMIIQFKTALEHGRDTRQGSAKIDTNVQGEDMREDSNERTHGIEESESECGKYKSAVLKSGVDVDNTER